MRLDPSPLVLLAQVVERKLAVRDMIPLGDSFTETRMTGIKAR